MAHQKREGSFSGEDLTAKRSKASESDTKGVEIQDNLNIGESACDNPVFVEMNGQNGSNSPQECKGNQMPQQKGSLEDKMSSQGGCKLTCIEADAAEDKGCRHTMEDAWVVLPDASAEYPGSLRCAHFAIYDGHGGRLAADFAQRHLHDNVLAAGLPRELMDIKAAKKAILEGFRKTDEALLQECSKGNWQDGATAVCVWVLGQMVIVANIGDAKAVLARSSSTEGSKIVTNEAGCSLKAIVLTREHKAIFPQERSRIQKAGGLVGPNGRLQGRLDVSRAFGDRQFKKLGVIATPDVHSFELTEREHFIILGCDGLWGVFGPNDAVEFVAKQLKETSSATAAARRLVREAVRERRCKDNCTAMVIVFRH